MHQQGYGRFLKSCARNGIREAPAREVKASGIGRTRDRLSLEEMAGIKYIDSDPLPGVKKLWWYGYDQDSRRQMERLIDLTGMPRPRKKGGVMGSVGALGGKEENYDHFRPET